MMAIQEHLPLIAVACVTLFVLFMLYRDLQGVKDRLAACDSALKATGAAPGPGAGSGKPAAASSSGDKKGSRPAVGAARQQQDELDDLLPPIPDAPADDAAGPKLKPALKQA